MNRTARSAKDNVRIVAMTATATIGAKTRAAPRMGRIALRRDTRTPPLLWSATTAAAHAALSCRGAEDAIAESVRRAGSVRTTPPGSRDSLRPVIVVVEGPSGAGKTTWCRRHGGPYALLEELPDHSTVPADPEAAARFWVERNVARWHQVLEREQRDGLIVVDVDPFKLHYVWTLWRTGQVPRLDWDLQREASRKAFSAGEYALADLYV